MEFTTFTLGTQYHFNKKTRVNAEAAFRDYEAVDWDSGTGPNDNLDGVDTRYSIQVTHIF
jgi:predicted porin